MRNLTALNAHRLAGPKIVEFYGWEGDDTCGVFRLDSAIDGGSLLIVAAQGDGWDHVSVSRRSRCPNWPEMEQVKRAFFADDEVVMQLHVPLGEHVNNHPYTLHLWRPLEQPVPRPPGVMVGLGGEPIKSRAEAMALRKRALDMLTKENAR